MKLIFALVMLLASPVLAEVVQMPVAYRHGEAELEGMAVYDDAAQGLRPGVLVIHAWWGRSDDELARARQLAEMGYVAFVLDMYGKGKLTDDPQQAGAWATPFYQDPALARARAAAGLNELAALPRVDPTRLAVIGYCFGGSMALQLAYSGAQGQSLRAAVSFHGNPQPPAAASDDAQQTHASLLILHGADDPLVPQDVIAACVAGLMETDIDWQLVQYGNAVHSFTTPGSEKHNIPGVAHEPRADARSWTAMQTLLQEAFSR